MEDRRFVDETDPDRPDELETWEVDESWIAKTGHECAGPGCGELIRYGDEIFVLEVVVLTMDASGLIYSPYLADTGDFLYEPLIIELECWEDMEEDICSAHQDTPAIESDEAVATCAACNSGICLGEVAGTASFGEIHLSRRTPNFNSGASTFTKMDTNPTLLCAACLNELSKDHVDLWADVVRQGNECEEGTVMRCWRHGCPGDCDNV